MFSLTCKPLNLKTGSYHCLNSGVNILQINRLFETVYILLNKKNMTANDLAEHFEDSKKMLCDSHQQASHLFLYRNSNSHHFT